MKLLVTITLALLLSHVSFGQVAANKAAQDNAAPAKSKDSGRCANCSDMTLLNAVNFDFTSKLTASYLGLLNKSTNERRFRYAFSKLGSTS